MIEISESEFRNLLKSTLDTIEAAFADFDPDLAECEQSLGSMTITFSDESRCILSAQPSVRQLWLALASRGTAYHFNWDLTAARWLDDKGRGIELMAFLSKFLNEMTGRELKLSQGFESGRPS